MLECQLPPWELKDCLHLLLGAVVHTGMGGKADQHGHRVDEIVQHGKKRIKRDLTEACEVICHVEKLNL